MKKILSLTLIALMMITFASGCSSEEKKVLYVCNWGEYMDESLNDDFYEQTGIKVVYDYFDTNESLYAIMQGGNVKYDVIFPSDYMVEKMIDEDMLAKIDFDLVPNMSNIYEQYLNTPCDPTGEYAVPYLWGTLGIIYNTTMVDEEVTSWDILWDEKYTGDILMIGNQRDAMAVALKKLDFSLNSVNETELLGAQNELVKQKPLLQAYVMDQVYNKMEGGNAALAVYYSGDALVMMENNSDLSFAVPEEGSNIFMDYMCIPKTSQHTDWAAQYINFMLEAESGARNVREVYGSTPNRATYELLKAGGEINDIMYPSQEVLARCEYNRALPDEIYELYNKIWTELGQ